MKFLVAFILAAGAAPAGTVFQQNNLVSNIPGLGAVTDANLKNPWGLSFGATSPFWVSNNGTNTSTLYNGAGAITPLVVSIPSTGPTGQVANGTTDFALTPGNPARFIFAAEDGSISGWNPSVAATSAVVEVPASPNNSYKGLALANNGTGNFLYAANFKTGHIDVYDDTFAATALAGNFTDPTLPSGFGPFNIELVGGNLYVSYAKVGSGGDDEAGPGNGFVTIFDTKGNFVQRLISNGPLNSPWGMTIAPASFGDFSNDLLVGNFGDGRVNAFDPATGTLLGPLLDGSLSPIVIDGLWALKTRTGGPSVDLNAVYFTAGLNDEADGLFGSLAVGQPTAGVPEPHSLALLGAGLLTVILMRSVRRRPSSRL